MTDDEIAAFLALPGDYDPYQTYFNLDSSAPMFFPCPGCKRPQRSRKEIEQGTWCPDCKNPCYPG